MKGLKVMKWEEEKGLQMREEAGAGVGWGRKEKMGEFERGVGWGGKGKGIGGKKWGNFKGKRCVVVFRGEEGVVQGKEAQILKKTGRGVGKEEKGGRNGGHGRGVGRGSWR